MDMARLPTMFDLSFHYAFVVFSLSALGVTIKGMRVLSGIESALGS